MNRQGFTLIELLIVIAIVGILAAIGLVNYSRWRASSAVMEGAQQFARDIDRTRTSSKRTNSCWRIDLAANTSATTYTLARYASDCTGTATVTTTRSMPAGTNITYTSGNTREADFSAPYGTTDAAPNVYTVKWASNSSITRTVRITSIMGKAVVK